MFNIFKRKKTGDNNQKLPQLLDLDKNPINPGDTVQSLRYELGFCKLIREADTYYYESLESGERVSWIRMIDAATEMQKVRKVEDSE